MESTFLDVSLRQADERPLETAFTFLDSNLRESSRLDFATIDSIARRVAATLQVRSSVGDRALLLLSSTPAFIQAMFGCLYSGVIAVSTHLRAKKGINWEHLESIVRDTSATSIITEDAFFEEVNAWIVSSRLAGLVRCLSLSSVDSCESRWKIPSLKQKDIAFLQYTSGSTSNPKGVAINHQNILANQVALKTACEIDEKTICVNWLPIYHDAGLIANVFLPFYLGAHSIHIAPMTFLSDPIKWLRVISMYKANMSGAPNFAYELCASRIEKSESRLLDLGSWDVAWISAEPIRATTLHRFSSKFAECGFRSEALFPCFGLAESTLVVTGAYKGRGPYVVSVKGSDLERGVLSPQSIPAQGLDLTRQSAPTGRLLVSSGKAVAGMHLAVVDPCSLERMADASVGEVWVRGTSVSAGYWQGELGRPIPFSAHVVGDDEGSYLRTGDLGFLHDSQLFITGRLKDQVIIRGRNLAAHDVEQTVQAADSALRVDAGAVFSVDHQGEEKLVIVQEVTRRSARASSLMPTIGNIRRAIIRGHSVVPHAILLIRPATLPKTTSGKIKRSAVKEHYLSNSLDALQRWTSVDPEGHREFVGALRPPSTSVESRLVKLWAKVLALPESEIGTNDNFFDLGGDSVALAKVHASLADSFSGKLVQTDLFEFSTISALARHLEAAKIDLGDRLGASTARPADSPVAGANDVAVIGMAGRFPDASNIDQFWTNLCAGRESIRRFSKDELLQAGVSASLIESSNFVPAGVTLEDVELFDATYFGMTPRDAESMDPQQRILLECAVDALENAGYPNEVHSGSIGVFVGRGEGFYQHRMMSRFENRASIGNIVATLIATSKSYASTLVSYHLNLTGPSVNVDTACSTSLVAVQQAYRSLLSGECDIALAGGVSVNVFGKTGYLYEEGGIASRDGHCSTFSEDANGTVFGSGIGLVVLKTLRRAIDDRDTIHAVIKGAATNNDGRRKVGYTAPSIAGQVEVIRKAFSEAAIAPESVGYIEAHGTSTVLGDPIEIAALSQVFADSRQSGDKKCAVGSVKTNIGHLDVAAGVAGLIKAILCVKNKAIPASLNFKRSNPAIDFGSSPFFVNSQQQQWASGKYPRRAGVNAFGVGGTNAHVIVEEPPENAKSVAPNEVELFILSAKNAEALKAQAVGLGQFLVNTPGVNLADAAFTLREGRTSHRFRSYFVSATRNQLLEKLDRWIANTAIHTESPKARSVVFMFPGQGSQQEKMVEGLYQKQAVFATALDRCADILIQHLGFDIRCLACGTTPREPTGGAGLSIDDTAIAQPLLFSVEYAIAQMWLALGVRPTALIGHSVGEYVAACLAGVFTLEDGLRLISMRGRLMQSVGAGSMLAVPIGEQELQLLLNGHDCDIASVNARTQCVVSGGPIAVSKLAESLERAGVSGRRLNTSHAFHSRMMDGILEEFRQNVASVPLYPPVLPIVSNVTGTWITAQQATDPNYWASHLRQTVRFHNGVSTLLESKPDICLEAGPGSTLTNILRKHANSRGCLALSSWNSAGSFEDFLDRLGQLWCQGIDLDWSQAFRSDCVGRIPLPTYPFQRKRHWLEDIPVTNIAFEHARVDQTGKQSIREWVSLPSWKRLALDSVAIRDKDPLACWLILKDIYGFGELVAAQLERQGHRVVCVARGASFQRTSDRQFTIDNTNEDDYDLLLTACELNYCPRLHVLQLWTLDRDESGEVTYEGFIRGQRSGFITLSLLAQSLCRLNQLPNVRVTVVTNGLHDITGNEKLDPVQGTVLGLCKVLPQELAHFHCHCVDIDYPLSQVSINTPREKIAQRIIDELSVVQSGLVVAYRSASRWVQIYEAAFSAGRNDQGTLTTALRQEGIYVITGGLGNIGLSIAALLASKHQALVVLVSRTPMPPPSEWDEWRYNNPLPDSLSRKIEGIRRLEALGAKYRIIVADVTNSVQMDSVFLELLAEFGRIDGVIHAAADMSNLFVPVQEITQFGYQQQCKDKVLGILVLHELILRYQIALCVVTSSISAVVGGLGLSAYAASNAFLDCFIERNNRDSETLWLSMNWDAWSFENGDAFASPTVDRHANATKMMSMRADEGMETFEQILKVAFRSSRFVISTTDLQSRLNKWVFDINSHRKSPEANRQQGTVSHSGRIGLRTEYVPPCNEVENTLVAIYLELLGVNAGIDDDFFELGGDSLLATQLLARISMRFNSSPTIKQFYHSPTIRAIAAETTLRGSSELPKFDYTSEAALGTRRVVEL